MTRNKLDITLELDTERGVELLKGLVEISDVLIENYSPRVMPNLGIGRTFSVRLTTAEAAIILAAGL